MALHQAVRIDGRHRPRTGGTDDMELLQCTSLRPDRRPVFAL